MPATTPTPTLPPSPPARRVPERRPPTEAEVQAARLHSAVRQAVANYEHWRSVSRTPSHPNYEISPRWLDVATRMLRMAMTANGSRLATVNGMNYVANADGSIGRSLTVTKHGIHMIKRAGA